ncbi:class I SAM-dependent methyltransferase [Pleomorphomonas oryzae]|uniref:class I SAM-dependent methyltransferase n=1 Tax=Pleomorphomonas oryzae TaxID=261934 RepID=UPI0004235B7E|nr:methyltransferase domain-containing protein [Pleomorphomonas oryzae]
MSLSDVLLFAREWFRNPLSVAAIFPSGRALASLMTREISAETGPVVELGPGTGVFTRALLKRGVRPQDLTLVEYSSDFARLLQTRFPRVRVLWMDAAGLDRSKLFDGVPVGAVVCGLGFLNMSQEKITAILKAAFDYLRPDGSLFLFTYGARCSVPDATLAELDLNAIWVGRTFQNIPPASVYRIERRSEKGG